MDGWMNVVWMDGTSRTRMNSQGHSLSFTLALTHSTLPHSARAFDCLLPVPERKTGNGRREYGREREREREREGEREGERDRGLIAHSGTNRQSRPAGQVGSSADRGDRSDRQVGRQADRTGQDR